MYFGDDYQKFTFAFDLEGNWNEIEKLLHSIIDQRSTKLGTDHPSTVSSVAKLAEIYGIKEGGMKQRGWK